MKSLQIPIYLICGGLLTFGVGRPPAWAQLTDRDETSETSDADDDLGADDDREASDGSAADSAPTTVTASPPQRRTTAAAAVRPWERDVSDDDKRAAGALFRAECPRPV